ncbi:hypothetical protein N7456_008473 [Penicillium angulare]|uniref:Xylanolytic transcriptional activator regulatory domain-containing protein n=1 Tax=Penicillium angulare TaxID=116970 RepID=A0A9W9FCR1_9EURO|nr:hypothetical protein N7456_008473 [Penicillium angulare]
MAFSKFKLDKPSQRTNPVPISAALPQSISAQESGHANDSLTRTGGCRKRRDTQIRNEPTSPGSESASSRSNLRKLSNISKDKRRRLTAAPWEEKAERMIDEYFDVRSAELIFHHYTGRLMPTCPVVIFSPETTASIARNTKPLLFMAIISVAAAGQCTPDHHRKFALEARNFLAGLAIFEGEKSLQLIQALLVVSFWYRAPENYARTNQNQLVSVTLSIAIDIGLDRVEESSSPQTADDQWNRAEAQRTWLACFLLSSSLVFP